MLHKLMRPYPQIYEPNYGHPNGATCAHRVEKENFEAAKFQEPRGGECTEVQCFGRRNQAPGCKPEVAQPMKRLEGEGRMMSNLDLVENFEPSAHQPGRATNTHAVTRQKVLDERMVQRSCCLNLENALIGAIAISARGGADLEGVQGVHTGAITVHHFYNFWQTHFAGMSHSLHCVSTRTHVQEHIRHVCKRGYVAQAIVVLSRR